MFDFQKRFWRVAIDITLDGTLNIDPGTYFPGANGDLFFDAAPVCLLRRNVDLMGIYDEHH